MLSAGWGQEPAGATPLEDEELEGLRQAWVTTREDLNEVEADNILAATNRWLDRRNRLDRLLDDKTVRDLHRDMFGRVWTWAGSYRRTEKSIGIDPIRISVAVRDLVEDAKYWFASDSDVDVDAAAVMFHHKLVLVHPFPNGNGRHSRLMTDLILRAAGGVPFSWGGGANLGVVSAVRADYIKALRAADHGDYTSLATFVRT
ncbi:mobile mystery protein B [Knoellia sp. S7-12]|uniref:mobile mystery protein B n=1 Tax=Knoellia sp. S7-12 TaxID=3126698 RepID=UPI0033694066